MIDDPDRLAVFVDGLLIPSDDYEVLGNTGIAFKEDIVKIGSCIVLFYGGRKLCKNHYHKGDYQGRSFLVIEGEDGTHELYNDKFMEDRTLRKRPIIMGGRFA